MENIMNEMFYQDAKAVVNFFTYIRQQYGVIVNYLMIIPVIVCLLLLIYLIIMNEKYRLNVGIGKLILILLIVFGCMNLFIGCILDAILDPSVNNLKIICNTFMVSYFCYEIIAIISIIAKTNELNEAMVSSKRYLRKIEKKHKKVRTR